VKGAFTDAKTDRVGRFEMAEGVTLFLDEIANISANLQAKLPRRRTRRRSACCRRRRRSRSANRF
jgi:DNA-binding NtrC family response regulator